MISLFFRRLIISVCRARCLLSHARIEVRCIMSLYLKLSFIRTSKKGLSSIFNIFVCFNHLAVSVHHVVTHKGGPCTKNHIFSHWPDHYCRRCKKCKSRHSVRYHSIFSHTRLPLYTACFLLVYFARRLTVSQISDIIAYPRQCIVDFYSWIRAAKHTYLQTNPILFDIGEVVEYR